MLSAGAGKAQGAGRECSKLFAATIRVRRHLQKKPACESGRKKPHAERTAQKEEDLSHKACNFGKCKPKRAQSSSSCTH